MNNIAQHFEKKIDAINNKITALLDALSHLAFEIDKIKDGINGTENKDAN